MLARGGTTVAAALMLAACAGPVETRTGADSSLPPSKVPVEVVLTGVPDALSGPTLAAIGAALADHGFATASQGAGRLTVALAERPAAMAVVSADGRTLSPAKRQRLLQSCEDRTQRMLLVLEMPDAAPVRAWAEEAHCHGTLAQSVGPLATKAVAALAGKALPVHVRRGRD